MEEAGAVNRKILEFCKENGVSGNRANLAAVCAEEMTVNIIKFGGKLPTGSTSIFAWRMTFAS